PGVQALANHQSGLDPPIEVLDARDADDRGEVAIHPPGDEAEFSRGPPDVGARAFDGPRAGGKCRGSCRSPRPNVTTGESSGDVGDREAPADRDPVTAAAGRDHAQPGD